MLEMYVEDLKSKAFKNATKVTNILYVMAKMKFTSKVDTERLWI